MERKEVAEVLAAKAVETAIGLRQAFPKQMVAEVLAAKAVETMK